MVNDYIQEVKQIGTDDTTNPNDPISVTFTLGAEASHVRHVTVQVCRQGTALARRLRLTIVPSASANGAPDATNNAITLTSAGSGVILKAQDSGNYLLEVETGSDGQIDLDLTQSSATGTRYLRTYINNKIYYSGAIAFTDAF